MSYIDDFVVPVSTSKKQAYREMSAKAAKMKTAARMKMTPDMPFDGQRMIFGGFEVLVDTTGAVKK